ncbi:MAG TPA: alpha/beta fold hydrolase [Steroidobacteraceae bacterium]|nr:alpha/beta fold hydrolase [Steroidobacteraceae bacterium]
MSTAPKTTSMIVPGPAGDIEVLLDEPRAAAAENVVVICHPHPLYGGTMTNKVVHTLARTFNELGMPAVRFNFRGVGKSTGMHDDGHGETDDALAMITWAEKRWPSAKLWLAGFSFGAAMALKASMRRASLGHPIARLITVAPALRWLTQLDDESPGCPWLIVQGDQDDLVDAQAVRNWVASLKQPPQLEILPRTEHFFHGRLNDLRDAIKSWLQKNNKG